MAEGGESEWPTVMIYAIFVAILLIMGIFMVTNMISFSEGSLKKNVDELKFTILSDRIINSADCAAWEEPFVDADGITKWQVQPGIIDLTKINPTQIENCVKGVDFRIEVTDLTTGQERVPVQSEAPGTKIRDVYFVKLYGNGEFHDGLMSITLFEE